MICMKRSTGTIGLFICILSTQLEASTYSQSLRSSSRDIFDNLSLNPAFVVPDNEKNYFRIGKSTGVESIHKFGSYGVGLQFDTFTETPVASGTFTSKEAPDTFSGATTSILRAGVTSVTERSVPVVFSVGSVLGSTKHGLSLLYHSGSYNDDLQRTTANGTNITVFSPKVSEIGIAWGTINGPLETSLGYYSSTYQVATSRRSHDGNLATATEVTTYMDDGASKQETKAFDLLVRYQVEGWKPSFSYTRSTSDLELWDVNDTKTGGTVYAAENAIVSDRVVIGTDRVDTIGDQVTFFSRPRASYLKSVRNGSKYKGEINEFSIETSHGAEVGLTPWLVARGGIDAVLYTKTTFKETYYANPGQRDNSETDAGDRTVVFESGLAPAFGLGFKFESFTFDAAVAQDGTSNVGFTDAFFSLVQLTAMY